MNLFICKKGTCNYLFQLPTNFAVKGTRAVEILISARDMDRTRVLKMVISTLARAKAQKVIVSP